MGNGTDDTRLTGRPRRVLILGFLSLLLSVFTLMVIARYARSGISPGDVFRVGYGTVVLGLLMVVVSWLVDGLRLMVLVRAMGGPASYIESVRISIAGAFMSGITPSDTGGEPLKIYYLHRNGMSMGRATATVTLIALLHATTRFLLWLAMPLVALILGLSWHLSASVEVALVVGLLAYLVFMAGLVASTFWPEPVSGLVRWLFDTPLVRRITPEDLLSRLRHAIRRVAGDFREALLGLRAKKAEVGFALLLSILYWVLVVSVPVFMLRAMGSPVSRFQAFTLSMTVYLVMAFVPSPGASGGAEAGSALLFAPFLPARVLGTFVILWRAVTYYFTLLIGGALVLADTVAHAVRRADAGSP